MRNPGKTRSQLVTLGSSFTKHDAVLRANSEAYEWLVKKVKVMDRRKRTEAVLGRIWEAARFAMEFHPGRYADGAIENVAFEIGMELNTFVAEEESIPIPAVRKESRRRVLHVAYEVLGIGGLTRMLYYWIRNDQSSCHSVLLMDQGSVPIPQWLSKAIRSSGGDLIVIPSRTGFCHKAQWLRGTARRGADLVVLHHCGFDMVPTVAFAVPGCPPVAVLNHADHQFWLGSSVSDLAINHRTEGANLTVARRFITRNTVIPVPLVDRMGALSRCEARRLLGIPEDQIILLSVGRPEKYRPSGPYDFLATAGKILDYYPRAHLYVVGETPLGIAPYLREPLHDRLHLVGALEDPSTYRAAADVYLESFPFGSQTALLEAVLAGLPPVLAYDPLFPLLVTNDDAIQDLISNPKDENEYIERVALLVEQAEWRMEFAHVLRKRLLVDHVGEGWLSRLAAIYEVTDHLTHCPRTIPISCCSLEKGDIGLSLWHVMADGRTSIALAPAHGLKGLLCHTAYIAKDVGNYATARRYACRALWQDPLTWTSWRLLGVSLIGKAGPFLRRMLSWVRLNAKKTSWGSNLAKHIAVSTKA